MPVVELDSWRSVSGTVNICGKALRVRGRRCEVEALIGLLLEMAALRAPGDHRPLGIEDAERWLCCAGQRVNDRAGS